MTESDRHEVICALAADLYNNNGSMENAALTKGDVEEIVEYYNRNYALLGIRMPTEDEIRIALFQVMGAKFSYNEDSSGFAHNDECHPDSAEIDHDDPINQG